MELYAAGFNSLNQLQSLDLEDQGETPSKLTSFNRIVPGTAATPSTVKEIKILATLWGATILLVDGVLEHRGFVNGLPSRSASYPIHCEKDIEVSGMSYFFGDEYGVFGAVHERLGLLLLKVIAERELWLQQTRRVSRLHDWNPTLAQDVAVRGDGSVCTYSEDCQGRYWLHRFSCLTALTDDMYEPERIELGQGLCSLQASTTAFAALQSDGQVLTFGCDLQPALLARIPNLQTPADTLSPVPFLTGIPIEKIVTYGWHGAALSRHRDLYIWGGRIGESQFISALPESGEEVRLVDIADGADIADVALGMNHMVVLTTSGEVWGCGDNEHGQLGLGETGEVFIRDWKRLTSDKDMGGKIVSLKAGGWGSWLVFLPER